MSKEDVFSAAAINEVLHAGHFVFAQIHSQVVRHQLWHIKFEIIAQFDTMNSSVGTASLQDPSELWIDSHAR